MPSAISVPTQRKTFLANGVIWAFWADTDIKYNTSLDGQNWGTIASIFSSPYGTGVLTGDEFAVWFDGTYANFAHGYSTTGGYTVAFRRAFPNVDSSIGWIAADQVITSATSIPRYLSVASDTNNYPWVAYQTNSSSSVQIYRSLRNDGSWLTQSGFPVTVYSAASVSLIPLKNQNMASILAITNGANWNVGAFTWFNGSSSFTSLITGTDLLAHPYVSAVANNDLVNVSIVYQNASSNLASINYNSLSNAFGTPVVFYSSPIATPIYPSASITTESGYIYSFWINSSSNNILYAYYSTTTNSWTSTFIFGPTQTSGFTSSDSLSVYYKGYGHYFGILSESNTPISGTLHFGVLLVTPDASLKPFYDIGYNPQQTTKINVVNNVLVIFNNTTASQIFSDVTQVAGVPIDVSTSNTLQPLIRFRNEDCGDVLKELQASSGWGIRINTDGSVRYAPDPASSPQALKTFTRGVNLLDVERTLETTSVINKLILAGSGAGTSQLSFVAQDFDSQAQFGVREKLVLMTSAYDPTLLQSYAQQLLADYKQPRDVLKVKVIDDSVGVVYNVGDYVWINDPLLGINGKYRVLEISKTFSSQGEETSLELGTIQFVSNAYSYKIPSLREVFGDVRTLAENASVYPQPMPQTATVSAQGVVASGSPLTFTFTIDSSTSLSVNNQVNSVLSQLYLSSTGNTAISSATVQLITPSGQAVTFSSVPIPSSQVPQPQLQTQILNVLRHTTQYGTYAVKIMSNSAASAPVSATYFGRFGSKTFAV